jgi:hypothetical protein
MPVNYVRLLKTATEAMDARDQALARRMLLVLFDQEQTASQGETKPRPAKIVPLERT